MPLQERDIERYARQIVIPEIGVEGQIRLLEARAFIVGTGPAAETALVYLRAAGVQAEILPRSAETRAPAVIDLSSFDSNTGSPTADAVAATSGCEAACNFVATLLGFDEQSPAGSLKDALA